MNTTQYLNEVREKKVDLEIQITTLLRDFTQEYGLGLKLKANLEYEGNNSYYYVESEATLIDL